MSRKRKKKSSFDFFGFGEDDFLFDAKSFSCGGSGYSISVFYDEKGKPVVKVETQGDVDVAELRRDIERRHPGAKIEGLEKRPLICVLDDKHEADKEEEKKNQKRARKQKKEKQPLIRIVE